MNSVNSEDNRPWQILYPNHVNKTLSLEYDSIVSAWQERVDRVPDAPCLYYFDSTLNTVDVDNLSDAIAVELQARGVTKGDRIGMYMQNIAYYPITLLALWKIGAIAVQLNPMYKNAELRTLVDDAEPTGLVAGVELLPDACSALEGSSVQWYLSASVRDLQERDDSRVAHVEESRVEVSEREALADIVAQRLGRKPTYVSLSREDLAFISYTSGTTGPAKGAVHTHHNYLYSVKTFANWIELGPEDVVFAIAPLFHITGVVLNMGVALLSDASLVLTGRFQPEVALDAFKERNVTFTIGSITAFISFLDVQDAGPENFHAIRYLYSGGAPIPPSIVSRFQKLFGPYLHNIWGMTETTAGGIAVPPGIDAPIDTQSGSLSIGVPTPTVVAWVEDPQGNKSPFMTEGELVLSAPQVVKGYWNNPEATKHTMPDGNLHTGDVAMIDQNGWVYLVDRLKDQINVSGYKVWPREVEDTLYEHPDVFEVAVVGEPDYYRGEAVVVYVSLVVGSITTAEQLIEFAQDRLAAYKRPREVKLVESLPKTASGKIRRQALRSDER